MERIVIGLPDFAIEEISFDQQLIIKANFNGTNKCPHCNSQNLRLKDTFWRKIKNIPLRNKSSILLVKCHKFYCKLCGKYFNTRLPGIKKWSRCSELLKKTVFTAYNNGYSNKNIALENNIGTASVERYYQQMIQHKSSQFKNRLCPRALGIDEHRFTKRQGFLTTFCDLQKGRVFEIAKGRSSSELHSFLCSLKGRERVRLICIDMSSAYRKMIKQYFPNAKIISDRFHVIKLVNHHFSKLCKLVDEKSISYGRGGLMRLLFLQKNKLNHLQLNRLQAYFARQPAIEAIYNFCHELNDLFRIKKQTKSACKRYITEFLDKIKQLKNSAFPPMKTLGKSLWAWQEEVVRMFRFNKSNGMTEGFHRKMKLIQRRAYGFRNFENYRLRVKVLCG